MANSFTEYSHTLQVLMDTVIERDPLYKGWEVADLGIRGMRSVLYDLIASLCYNPASHIQLLARHVWKHELTEPDLMILVSSSSAVSPSVFVKVAVRVVKLWYDSNHNAPYCNEYAQLLLTLTDWLKSESVEDELLIDLIEDVEEAQNVRPVNSKFKHSLLKAARLVRTLLRGSKVKAANVKNAVVSIIQNCVNTTPNSLKSSVLAIVQESFPLPGEQ